MFDQLNKEITVGKEAYYVVKNSCGVILESGTITDIKNDTVIINKKSIKSNEIVVKDFEYTILSGPEMIGKNVIWASNKGVQYGKVLEAIDHRVKIEKTNSKKVYVTSMFAKVIN